MRNDGRHNEQMLAEAIPHGIIILTPHNKLKSWNQIATKLLGIDTKQHELKSISELLTDEVFKKLTLSKNLELESPIDKEIILSLMIRPYCHDHQLIIIQDVTHTYRLEAMREDFIANVSHELRTPLTVFHGYLEILQNYHQIDPRHFEEMLHHMTTQCQRMERLVQDLLLLSKLESDEPNRDAHHPVDIAAMLENICKDAKLLSGDQQHEFHCHINDKLIIMGQAEELRSAFSNLIYNAVHYTPAKGRIDIYWYEENNKKIMKVTDTGIGIPEKYISRITQRFYRVDKARAYDEKGGTGLGLAIVKHVLLRHNASLSIQSKANQGSTFCCIFD